AHPGQRRELAEQLSTVGTFVEMRLEAREPIRRTLGREREQRIGARAGHASSPCNERTSYAARMLGETFLDAIPEAERPRFENPDLEGLLERIVEDARVEHPGIELTNARFVRYLGERAGQVASSWLLDLPPGDLYLACACGAGDATAIARLEALYFP